MRIPLRYLFLFCLFFCLVPISIKAQQPVTPVDYTGSRSTSNFGAFTTSGSWSSGLKVAWNISFSSSTKLWNYTYTVSKASGAALGSTNNLLYIEAAWKSYPAEFKNTGSPAMTGSFYSQSWNEYMLQFTTSSTGLLVVSFTSEFAPIWGDFYYTNSSGAVALNSGYNINSKSNSNLLSYIAAPGGANVNVPEPVTWLLLTLLLIPIVFLRHKVANRRER